MAPRYKKLTSSGIGRRVRALREALGIPREELARLCSVSTQVFATMEKADGSEPSWPVILRIAEALGLGTDLAPLMSDEQAEALRAAKAEREASERVAAEAEAAATGEGGEESSGRGKGGGGGSARPRAIPTTSGGRRGGVVGGGGGGAGAGAAAPAKGRRRPRGQADGE